MRKIVFRASLLASVYIFCSIFCTALQAQVKQPVKWQFTIIPVNEKQAQLVFTASLNDGWHIYSQFLEEGGPLPTTFKFTASKDYSLIGKVKEESTPVRSYDTTFMMDIAWFSRTAVFSQLVKLHAQSATVKGKIEFMLCTGEMCLPPDEVGFSVEVKAAKQGENNKGK